jgi:BirA family biotin operon repressor/biotin-[acetyl-CoA-carboxylase] ligase
MQSVSNTTLGETQLRVAECASTNTLAAELLGQGNCPHGTVVVTDAQTAGRGQQGTPWVSEPHANLTCSVVLHPQQLAATEVFRLGQAVALAVRQTVAEVLEAEPEAVTIKWPNDILVQGRKIAGLLIETQLQGSRVSTAIVGIGLNVNQLVFAGNFSRTPTSLLLEAPGAQPFELQAVLEHLLRNLEVQLWRLESKQHERIGNDYTTHLWRRGEVVRIQANGTEHSAHLLGVDANGRLLLQFGPDTNRLFDPKTLQFLD